MIEESKIEQMNTLIAEKTSEVIAFKGTLLVHQVTGSAYIPNQLKMKSLSCFCDPDGCDHFRLGSIKYESKLPVSRLKTSTVFTDSEEDMPLSTYVKYNNINPTSNCAPSTPGVSEYAKAQQQNRFNSGDYVLLKYVAPKAEYHYAGICTSVDDEKGELRVTFLKICDKNGTLFRLDENDVSDVQMEQVIKKLPVPNIVTKGNRVFYQFKSKIDVFEK